MKKFAEVAGVLLMAAAWCFPIPSDVTYSDGEASVRYKTGRNHDLAIGDLLDTGDTVTTGYDGFVELDQAGLTVKINPDTVFALQEKEQGGAKTGVLALVLGSIKFRFNKLTGKEPLVQTGACVAAVRGTEFSVFAGADGSSLIVVDSGQVEVEAVGNAVSLSADEGVEVRPGEPPGEKFKVQRDQIDYKAWNDQKIAAMLEDPIAAMRRVQDRLSYYVQEISAYDELYNQYMSRLDAERTANRSRAESEGVDVAQACDREVIFPLSVQTFNVGLNVRYYALAALSLRRYVAGRFYVLLKSQHLAAPDASRFSTFLGDFRVFLDLFERLVVPQLVETDI
jgi:hypothetical protein